MAVTNEMTFGGISSTTYSVIVAGYGEYGAPRRVVESYSIPGRNGNVTIDQGHYENITIKYDIVVHATSHATFKSTVDAYRNAIVSQLGYQRLTDTYHTGEYRMARYAGGFDNEPTFHGSSAVFTIEFDCKPQRFLTTGETATAVTSGSSITNATKFASEPLIEITGDGTLYIGDYSLVLDAGASNPVHIDCELMEAYEINSSDEIVNRNNLVTYQDGTFPRIEPGANLVTYSGNITAVKITPRWWTI